MALTEEEKEISKRDVERIERIEKEISEFLGRPYKYRNY